MAATARVAAVGGDGGTPEALAPVGFGRFVFHSWGMEISGPVSYDDWAEAGQRLALFAKGLAFAVGDWLVYGEHEFGEQAAQAIDAQHWSESTVRAYRWLAERVPPGSRVDGLDMAHHLAVAKLPPAEQRKWLRSALEGDGGARWSVTRLKTELAKADGRPTSPLAYYVLAECRDASDQASLLDYFRREERPCEAVRRRRPQRRRAKKTDVTAKARKPRKGGRKSR